MLVLQHIFNSKAL